MPRIDPIKLLNCLNVLLSPNGGIKSRDEVQRLACLMTKFSKKLVSKCIYIQILKYTETELLGLYMGSGGWFLVHMWLTESIVAKNWPLVKELLELLLLCPVDIERLKTNNCPKLVKELSKDGNHFAIRALASKLVEQWLKSVKGEQVVPISITDIPQIIDSQLESHPEISVKPEPSNKIEEASSREIDTKLAHDIHENNVPCRDVAVEEKDAIEIKNNDIVNGEPEALPILKISLKDGKQTISQVNDTENKTEDVANSEKILKDKKSKDKSSDKRSHSSKSSSSKDSNKSHSSSEKHKSSHRSSSSSSRHSSKDKSKDKERHSSHSSRSKSESSSRRSSSSSSSSKTKGDNKSSSEKEKNKDRTKDKEDKSVKTKDKDVVSTKSSTDIDNDKIQTPSIQKLGKIPKLSDVKKEKPSISIEVRKPDEPKPKTVKTFHSKFRKHGLEEEVKPPPSRASVLTKKAPPAAPPAASLPKRPSPAHHDVPPDKKPKTMEPIDKPGAIKLIPPKPKPMLLLESDMFMDALNASATNKKEPKKRKRRTSGSKDGNPQNETSPPHTPTTNNSPSSESKSVPPRFYQDTLDTEETKEKTADKVPQKTENVETSSTENDIVEKMDTSEPHTLTINGLKGVLCYHKRKGPKKSIRWKPDTELEEIQYFELDETERVNVTKTFTDMKYLERIHEREAFQKARNLSTDDIMEEKTNWKPLILVDAEGQIEVEYGKNSKEKDIQAIRQKGTLQPLYFHKSMIPDSPLEAEPETHPHSEPTIIPLEDVTGNVSDFRNISWPEPKGNAPPAITSTNITPLFPTNINQFPNNFPNGQFPGVPGFQGPNMMPADWPPGVPPHMMASGMPGTMPPPVMAPGAMPPGTVPPTMLIPPENMMMNPEMFGAPNAMFPMPPEGFNMQPNMFAMNFNMQGPPGPDFTGPGNFRGAMRGRGAGGWQGKVGGAWEGPQRGRGAARGTRKTVCIYFQRKGSCRQGDNCSFLHPGVNGPF